MEPPRIRSRRLPQITILFALIPSCNPHHVAMQSNEFMHTALIVLSGINIVSGHFGPNKKIILASLETINSIRIHSYSTH